MAFKVTVEIPLFLTFFGFLLTDSLNTNLLIYRTCYVTLMYDKHNCSLLGHSDNNITKHLEKLVQPKSDVIAMVKTIIDSITTAILCLFVGAWSDRFGRKPVLVITLVGYTLMNLYMVIFSAIENMSPWLMMLCSVPVILTGGGASLLIVFLAYLTDITSEEERGFRMAFFEGIMALATLSGSFSSSYVFNATGYVATYSIATFGCLLALVYTIFFINESLDVRETSGRFKGFFDRDNVKGMFRTAFKVRPHFNRSIILLTIVALALYYVTIFGDGSVMFLFMREKFYWNLRQYTWFTSTGNLLWITSCLLIVYLIHYKLHVKESTIMFFGFLSLTFGALIQGLAQIDWLVYVAALVRIPSGGLSPMTRSLLSKLVDVNEVGKIFAVYNVIQSLLGFIGAPVYTNLYNATLTKNPGTFNFLTATINFCSVICLVLVLLVQNRTTYSTLQATVEENVEH